MTVTSDLDGARRAVGLLCADLRAALADGIDPQGRTPADWPGEIAALDQLAVQVAWARDAATTVARRAEVAWTDIADATGVSDSTLYDRYRRFLAREYS